jgi:sigma-E factor negative regulatory protein RseC
MIDAQGIVTALDGDYAIVQMDETGCGRCHEQGGCGGNNIGKIFCSTPRTFRVLNPGKSPMGARVRVMIADGAVRRSALYAYGFPLLAIFAGAIGGSALAGEPGAIAGAVGNLLGAWFLLKRSQSRNKPDAQFEAHIHP